MAGQWGAIGRASVQYICRLASPFTFSAEGQTDRPLEITAFSEILPPDSAASSPAGSASLTFSFQTGFPQSRWGEPKLMREPGFCSSSSKLEVRCVSRI